MLYMPASYIDPAAMVDREESEIVQLHRKFLEMGAITFSVDRSTNFKSVEKFLNSRATLSSRPSSYSEMQRESSILSQFLQARNAEELKEESDNSLESSENPALVPKATAEKVKQSAPAIPTRCKIKYKFFCNGEEIKNKRTTLLELILQQVTSPSLTSHIETTNTNVQFPDMPERTSHFFVSPLVSGQQSHRWRARSLQLWITREDPAT